MLRESNKDRDFRSANRDSPTVRRDVDTGTRDARDTMRETGQDLREEAAEKPWTKIVNLVVGVLLLVVGVLGFLAPGLGGFHLSATHNLIHLVSGAIAVYYGTRRVTLSAAKAFAGTFGAIYALLGIAGFVFGDPGTPSMAGMGPDENLLRLIPGSLELGTSDHTFHILLGVVFLIAAFLPYRADVRRNTYTPPV